MTAAYLPKLHSHFQKSPFSSASPPPEHPPRSVGQTAPTPRRHDPWATHSSSRCWQMPSLHIHSWLKALRIEIVCLCVLASGTMRIVAFTGRFLLSALFLFSGATKLSSFQSDSSLTEVTQKCDCFLNELETSVPFDLPLEAVRVRSLSVGRKVKCGLGELSKLVSCSWGAGGSRRIAVHSGFLIWSCANGEMTKV